MHNMLEFLKEYHITEEEIDDIQKNNSMETIHSLSIIESKVKETMNYLESIGIEVLPILWKNHINIFFLTEQELKNLFEPYELKELIAMINLEPWMIEYL